MSGPVHIQYDGRAEALRAASNVAKLLLGGSVVGQRSSNIGGCGHTSNSQTIKAVMILLPKLSPALLPRGQQSQKALVLLHYFDFRAQIIRLLLVSQAMARPFATPLELAADHKSALTAAFDATMRDADFLAEAQKLNFEIHPVSAPTIDSLLTEVYATPKDVLARAAKAISSAVQ